MKSRLPYPLILTLLSALALGSPAQGLAQKALPALLTQKKARQGYRVEGLFKKINTDRKIWTVTIKPLDQERSLSYRLAGNASITYRGEFIPWQQGILIDSHVELIFKGGKVTSINVLEWSS